VAQPGTQPKALVAPDPLDVAFSRAADSARRLIDKRLADARAHAQLGRKAEAYARLDELTENLCRHLNESRTGFCRSALGYEHAKTEHIARVTPILGRDQHADLRATVAEAKAGLRGLLIGAVPEPYRVTHWEKTHGAAISRQISGALSNSQMAITTGLQTVLNQ
jgi:hypothetical protein